MKHPLLWMVPAIVATSSLAGFVDCANNNGAAGGIPIAGSGTNPNETKDPSGRDLLTSQSVIQYTYNDTSKPDAATVFRAKLQPCQISNQCQAAATTPRCASDSFGWCDTTQENAPGKYGVCVY